MKEIQFHSDCNYSYYIRKEKNEILVVTFMATST